MQNVEQGYEEIVEKPAPFFAQKGSIGWQTPPDIIEASREVLGPILLDPCAGVGTDIATINARLPVDGLTTPWDDLVGSVVDLVSRRTFFENVPFGTSYVKGGVCLSATEYKEAFKEEPVVLSAADAASWRMQNLKMWAEKTVLEVGRGWEGIWISKAALETHALQLLMGRMTAICHPKKRINYVDPATGKVQAGVNFSSVLLYFGPRHREFCDVFDRIGTTISVGI